MVDTPFWPIRLGKKYAPALMNEKLWMNPDSTEAWNPEEKKKQTNIEQNEMLKIIMCIIARP